MQLPIKTEEFRVCRFRVEISQINVINNMHVFATGCCGFVRAC
jgi:hypothetical protein